MVPSPGEIEMPCAYVVADPARERRDRGVRPKPGKVIGLIPDPMLEGACDAQGVSDSVELGRTVATRERVMPRVPDMVRAVQHGAAYGDQPG